MNVKYPPGKSLIITLENKGRPIKVKIKRKVVSISTRLKMIIKLFFKAHNKMR